MFERKKFWIIPIIAALVAVLGLFATLDISPGREQSGTILAQEEELAPFLGWGDKPVGTYALVSGKVIPVKEGMVLGKAEDIKGPVVLGGRGDDYYNYGETRLTNINGELVVTKAVMKHVDYDSPDQYRYRGCLPGETFWRVTSESLNVVEKVTILGDEVHG